VITDSFRHPIPGFTDVGQRAAIVMPLRAQHNVVGVIAVARNRTDRRSTASTSGRWATSPTTRRSRSRWPHPTNTPAT
jgi:hypothetical protein